MNVEFKERAHAHRAGARWDDTKKRWFIDISTPISGEYAEWIQNRREDCSKHYIDVPFAQKDKAKASGAKWDADLKLWYYSGSSTQLLSSWPPVFLYFLENMTASEAETDAFGLKKLGAKWSSQRKQLYVTSKNNLQLLKNWLAVKDTDPEIVSSAETEPILTGGVAPTAGEALESANSRGHVMIFDVETTGLPTKNAFNIGYKDLAGFDNCRLVQLCCILCRKDDFEIVDTYSSVIAVEGFTITNESFHGVSMTRAQTEGRKVKVVLQEFMDRLNRSSHVIAHNAWFDENVIKSELVRAGMTPCLNSWDTVKVICSMKATKTMLKLPSVSGTGFKNPSLKELFEHVLGEKIHGQHDATNDVLNLHRALHRLYEDKVESLFS